MFSKIILLTLASYVFAAVPPMQNVANGPQKATPAVTPMQTVASGPPKSTPEPISQCPTGNAQCCESTQKATDAEPAKLLSKLGVTVQGTDVLVGVTCSSIPTTDPSCAHTPVCCENNNYNGVINIGCSPLSL